MNLWSQFLKYQRDLVYVDNGNALRTVCVGLSGTFYFWGGSAPAVQQAVANCFQVFEDRLTTQLARQPGRATAAALREHLTSLKQDQRLSWRIGAGRSPDEASDCYMAVYTAQAWQTSAGEPFLSWLNFAVPIDAVHGPLGQPALFLDLLRYCCAELRPWQGSAGLASLLPEDASPAFASEFDLQQRYYGLDVVSTGHLLNGRLQRTFKGANWLTFFDKKFPWPHAGILPPALQHHPGISHWTHGPTHIIQAGAEPVLAPVADGIPPLYQAVSDALRPVRLSPMPSLHAAAPVGDICFNPRTSDLWARRFDAPGIWPPYPGQLQFPETEASVFAEEPRQSYPPAEASRDAASSLHSRTFTFIHHTTGEPLAFQPYRLEASDGQVFEGVTDAQGVAHNILLPKALPVNAMLFLPRDPLGSTNVTYLNDLLEPSDDDENKGGYEH